MSWTFETIGIVHSPCKEKFAVPRQSGLAPALKAQIEIIKPYDREEAFTALDGFSHIWVISVFHQAQRDGWQSTVRPPRLGGNERVGVFASRAPYRPNPIALSVIEYHGLEKKNGKLFLNVSGVDLVNGTPVLDIKPYIPYADQPDTSTAGYVTDREKAVLNVEFSYLALLQCGEVTEQHGIHIQTLIAQLLRLDPRPAYINSQSEKLYGVNIANYNVKFVVEGQAVKVLRVEPVN